MKTAALFFGLSALLSATFVLANPTPTVAKRCEACDEACPKNWFYYHPKQCCLQSGGPPKVVSPPTGKACPWDWYWHIDHGCCTPKSKPPTTFPVPTCQNTIFSWWNPFNQCCEHPGKPQTSPVVVKGIKYKKSVHTKNAKQALKARQEDLCPLDLEFCPIPDTEGGFECIDRLDMKACGGCPSLGKGQDCTAISGAVGVGCAPDPLTTIPVCQVTSCRENFTLSPDGRSCTAVLASQ